MLFSAAAGGASPTGSISCLGRVASLKWSRDICMKKERKKKRKKTTFWASAGRRVPAWGLPRAEGHFTVSEDCSDR